MLLTSWYLLATKGEETLKNFAKRERHFDQRQLYEMLNAQEFNAFDNDLRL